MIAYAEIECRIYDAQSLKQKRSVLKRILTRISNEHNVTVSEMEHQELWQRTLIAVATVSNDKIQAERTIQQVLKVIDSFPEIERGETSIDWL